MSDYRDLCLFLVASETALLERVTTLEQEGEAYRALAHEAIHALHAVTLERDAYQQKYYAALAARRTQPMREAA